MRANLRIHDCGSNVAFNRPFYSSLCGRKKERARERETREGKRSDCPGGPRKSSPAPNLTVSFAAVFRLAPTSFPGFSPREGRREPWEWGWACPREELCVTSLKTAAKETTNLITWQPLRDLSKILTENDWPRTNKACRPKALYILSLV